MTDEVTLREVTQEDVLVFFEYQLDPEAARMAAVPTRDRDTPSRRARSSQTTRARTNDRLNGQVAAPVLAARDLRLVGYWLGRVLGKYRDASVVYSCGRAARPLHAHVAKHNGGSIRVLERCGFLVVGEGTVSHGPSGEVIEELTMRLDAGGAIAAR
jgi:RimJ/RimL family protein N-acetyltransferase